MAFKAFYKRIKRSILDLEPMYHPHLGSWVGSTMYKNPEPLHNSQSLIPAFLHVQVYMSM